MSKKQNLYIDIFAGCGGLSTGLLKAGWTGLFAVEKNADAFSTLEHNLIKKKKHFLWPDWLEVKEHDINELIKYHEKDLLALQGKITLVAGGPPCQGFSMAGKRDKNDQRNKLVKSYIKFIKLVMPEAIIFENVHGFTVNFKDKKGTKKYSSYVERALKRLGYKTYHKIVDMSEYSVPQKRKRFILVAMKNHSPKDVFSLLENNREKFCNAHGIANKTTVYEAISDLEKGCGTCPSPDTKGFKAGIYGVAQSGYQKLMRQGMDGFNGPVDSHRFVNHREDTISLHKDLLKNAPIGKRITPNDNIVEGLNRRGVTVLDKNSQAPTITSIPDELVHYCEPRILTVREHARIQSFPDWYEFKGKYTSGGARRKKEVPRYTQVGNAVPPLFAEQIGIALMEVLKDESKNETLAFKVSAGLKNLIGRDLISDKYIAIFELVKNSYDANASMVKISYLISDQGVGKIIISDNGSGMTYKDIIQKWLFVAYSEKKPQNRSKSAYREEIKREVAGAKGVGRFSCDRLGASLQLVTKTKDETRAHVVNVNWNKFEVDDTKEFIEIPVDYTQIDQLPSGFNCGTTLIVDNLREAWNREELLKLKRSLMKLISPDADKGELPFEIEMDVPSEKETDERLLEEYHKNNEKGEDSKKKINLDRDILNGKIKNDIFEKLNIKTTNIEVVISEDGRTITSTLSDRGQYIFTVKEKNRKYALLKNIHISIFYLNQSAKINFTRQMGGVTPKSYGSVFIYKNGFRINPYGESGQDIFGIDQRKAQGWKRHLGTREIMGRISIKGDNDDFVETTSRAHGFIQTPAVDMLADLFVEKVLKVLEKYVVHLINWGEPLKSNHNHTVTPEEIGGEIVSQFITNINTDDILNVDCNPQIINKESFEKEPDSITSSLKKLESVAEKTQDSGLLQLAQTVKKRTEAILSDNIKLEEDNIAKEKELAQVRQESEVRKKQVYFLSGAANQNVTNLVGGFHTVYTLTDAIRGNINFLREELAKGKTASEETILMVIGEIYQANEKAHKLADLAIHGNQKLKQDGVNSIYDFIRQYIDADLAIKGIEYVMSPSDNPFNCKFDASSVGIILDNISSNALKAGATKLYITLQELQKYVEISFTDNGIGLDKDVDVDMLFEWGVSDNISKKGFGIGLYHIKQLVEEMKGTVAIDSTYRDGFRLVVKLRR